MYSYLMVSEVARQRMAEQHEAARKASRRRAARKAMKAQRNGAAVADALELPAVPDYVDGTFRAAGDTAVDECAAR
jgi:hypothetical protein